MGEHTTTGDATPAGAPSEFGLGARRQLLRIAVILFALNILVPLVTYVYAKASGQYYWKLFWGEDNLVTWFSTIQLLLVGAAAYANYVAAGLVRERGGWRGRGQRWIWLIFALGFVFLSIDERFRVHENLREFVLTPSGLFDDIPYLMPGDVGLFLYLGVGLVFTVFLVAELRRRPLALILFGAAIGLTFVIVLIDSLPHKIPHSWPLGRFWTSIFEEGGENFVQWLFLVSFLLVLDTRLAKVGAAPAAAGVGIDAAVAAMRRQLVYLAGVLCAVNVLVPLGLVVYADFAGLQSWRPFQGTYNTITWVSSLQLLLVGILAYFIFEATASPRRLETAAPGHRRWIWLVFALGFVWLAIDERFEVHEWLRLELFRPHGILVGVPFLAPGEVGLMLYFAVGLVFTKFLLPELRRHPPALTLFLSAVALTLVTIVIDSLNAGVTRGWHLRYVLIYTVEETGEIWAQFLFSLSFLLVLSRRLAALGGLEPAARHEPPEPAPAGEARSPGSSAPPRPAG